MRHRLLGLIALLACAHAANVSAQLDENLDQPLPRGQSPATAPLVSKYPLQTLEPDPLTRLPASQSLDILSRPEPPLRLRGAKEMAIFRDLAPSVVLVLTDDGSGSGSLLSLTNGRGVILTNWHVIRDAQQVGVVFKPAVPGQEANETHAIRARVTKVDPIRDLALLTVEVVPAHVKPLPLGSVDEVQIGADVHAIGHPIAGNWSYTKGLVSQVRPAYEWQTGDEVKHKADVIQTQTPINPGNSGGPLIADSGRLIGVNSFKAQGEGLNFAVSVGEVQRFLAAAEKGEFEPKPAAARKDECEPKPIFEGRNASGDAFIQTVDYYCTGKVSAVLTIPDDKSKPIRMSLDINGDGKADVIWYDRDRDGKWDVSFWDVDHDGKIDLVGHHPDGAMKPSRTEKYTPRR